MWWHFHDSMLKKTGTYSWLYTLLQWIYTIRTCILKFRDDVSVIVAHWTHTHIMLLWYTFRAHRNTWKTTIAPQCLVNSSKYTSRPNSSIGETSSIFFNSSSRITIAKTMYKMHVAIFHVRKYERHISNSVHYQTLTKKPQRVLDTLKEMHFTQASLARSSARRITSR